MGISMTPGTDKPRTVVDGSILDPGHEWGGAMTGWDQARWESWQDLDWVRARLAAGADPNGRVGLAPVLHPAAERGSPEVVAELAARADDVDIDCEGRSALWRAVYWARLDNARALAAAGADPWRPMMGGWSPGRLGLAGRMPDLFGAPPDGAGLSPRESAEAAAAHRLADAVAAIDDDGFSISCVAGIDAAEAIRRLEAVEFTPDDPEQLLEELMDDIGGTEGELILCVTDVGGGCVVAQPWGFGAEMTVVGRLLSAGTVCYSMFANPKSGSQGSLFRDGRTEAWDLNPGGGEPEADDPPEEILRAFLYQDSAAYCCGYVGLVLEDARPIAGPPDHWVRLPPRDYWAR
jgi:hypothetical protein